FWPEKKSLLRTEHRTSGTTGTPLRIVATLGERGFTQAIIESWFRRVCGSRFPKTLALTGFMTPKRGSRTLFWKDPLKRHVFLNIYALSEANRDAIIKLIESFNPSLIFGYSSALGELAYIARDSLAEKANERIAITTADVLHPRWREQL